MGKIRIAENCDDASSCRIFAQEWCALQREYGADRILGSHHGTQPRSVDHDHQLGGRFPVSASAVGHRASLQEGGRWRQVGSDAVLSPMNTISFRKFFSRGFNGWGAIKIGRASCRERVESAGG